jgi:chromosome partitioning protein
LIIALTGQKGGTGKTTTAIHLAWWLSQKAKTIAIDADPQNSLSLWAKHLGIPCQIENDPEELFDRIPNLARQYQWVIIDAPGGLNETIKAILGCADLALIPCQPSPLDLHSTQRIFRILSQIQTMRRGHPKGFTFINRGEKNTVLMRETQQYLKQCPVPLLNEIVWQRQCIADCLLQKQTVFTLLSKPAIAAAQNYEALFQEIFNSCPGNQEPELPNLSI